jgi:hypothetical protein
MALVQAATATEVEPLTGHHDDVADCLVSVCGHILREAEGSTHDKTPQQLPVHPWYSADSVLLSHL